MTTPNWQHHSKKERKRKLKPQALRSARERRRHLIKSLLKTSETPRRFYNICIPTGNVMHMPADLGDNPTYEDYLEEARLTVLFSMQEGESDESIVKLLVTKEDILNNIQGWDLDINEAIQLVKKARSMD